VAIAVPWANVPAAVAGLQWDDQAVIDPTNAFNADLGGRTSSETVAKLVPGAWLVKAANTLAAKVLSADPHEAGCPRDRDDPRRRRRADHVAPVVLGDLGVVVALVGGLLLT
jgi:predicted dinucleotide-binding enzyme